MKKLQTHPGLTSNTGTQRKIERRRNGVLQARPLSDLARAAFSVIIALVLMTSMAAAETINSSGWGFSATFPGQSKMTAEPIQTRVGNVTMINYTFENETQAFMIALTDYPKGTVESAERSYNGAIEGFASGVKGTIRNRVPFRLGNVSGYDFIVDGPPATGNQQRMAFHVRAFIVGDRLYQVAYGGPMGTEQGLSALAFLNSFRLF
jgi:hypothetical protein